MIRSNAICGTMLLRMSFRTRRMHAATNVFSDKTQWFLWYLSIDDSIQTQTMIFAEPCCYECLFGQDAMVPMISVVVMYYFDSQTTNRSITMLLWTMLLRISFRIRRIMQLRMSFRTRRHVSKFLLLVYIYLYIYILCIYITPVIIFHVVWAYYGLVRYRKIVLHTHNASNVNRLPVLISAPQPICCNLWSHWVG